MTFLSRQSFYAAVFFLFLLGIPAPAQSPWHFAVSGDSRNCGDIVMPAIAASATQNAAQFYWHLGDLRLITDFDQDMVRRGEQNGQRKPMSISTYERIAWDDFIQHQVGAFGKMPVFVGVGNHETYYPKDRSQFLIQFADWLNTPVLREQRLKDDPSDHKLRTYFHWVQGGVDFIYLDNATPDQFDDAQIKWFDRVVAKAATDPSIKSVVVGMHAALPDSLASGHSMNDWAQGEQSGRHVYQALLKLQNESHKHAYALASHSHFVVKDVYNSEYLRSHGGVITGWIVGSAGAERYPLPPAASQSPFAKTNLYGYLLGTVAADGSIQFDFQEVTEGNVPADVAGQYPADAVHDCFVGNTQVK